MSSCTKSWNEDENKTKRTERKRRIEKTRQQIESKGKFYAKFELLTIVVMKIYFYWNITLCNPMKDNKCFGRTHRLQLQVRRISQTRK
jgi:hypothetical protein